jgi:polyferredoxin
MAWRQNLRRALLFFTFLFLPVTLNYYSVVLIIQSASEGTANFSLFFWSAFFLTSLLIGRAACPYICPLGAIQEVKDRMFSKRLVKIRYLRALKYVLLLAWVGAIVFALISAGGYKRIELLYQMPSGVSVDAVQTLIMFYIVVSIPLLPALFLGKRAFCHYFCPWGVLNTIGSWIGRRIGLPSLRLRASPAACKNCHSCDRVCPMSLEVSKMVQTGKMENRECFLCGSCVDACPQHAVKYSWK